MSKKSQYYDDRKDVYGKPNRVCTTCGKPHTNYRCRKCWKEIRLKSDCSGPTESYGSQTSITR